MNMRSSMFYGSSAKEISFPELLKLVQEYMSSGFYDLMSGEEQDDGGVQRKRQIRKFLEDHPVKVENLSGEALVDALYQEMAGFSFLTEYLENPEVEEININAWNDIQLITKSGVEKLDRHFDSPQHAINVVRRMLSVSGSVLDNASPVVLGKLGKNIRVAVAKEPIVDEEVGVSASIRIVNPSNLGKEDLIKSGTATEEMLEFLSACTRYGVSVCVAGATGSGKTTILGWMMDTIPPTKRILTIEDGSREFSLVREEDGKIITNAIHMQTRKSDNEKQSIDQEDLLDLALRMDPDIICVGEMRSKEAYAAQEAARTGHTVLSTIHSNSCEATYRRMCTLCKRKYDLSDAVLMDLVTEAFPVIVFCKQLDDRSRKLMEIMECVKQSDGSFSYVPLYQYFLKKTIRDEGRIRVEGEHKKVGVMSGHLVHLFQENGMLKEQMDLFLKKGEG